MTEREADNKRDRERDRDKDKETERDRITSREIDRDIHTNGHTRTYMLLRTGKFLYLKHLLISSNQSPSMQAMSMILLLLLR